MLRRLSFLMLIAAAVLGAVPVGAQDDGAGPVVVADVRGPLDQRALDFLVEAIYTPDAQIVVIKIDNPGIASGDPTNLFAAVADSETPVVAWVGPDGAVAYGGVAQLLEKVAVAGAAQGAQVGHTSPTVAGDEVTLLAGDWAWQLRNDEVVIEDESSLEPIAIVQPTIGQFIAELDGMEVIAASTTTTLETATEITLDDGSVVTVSSVDVRFLKPTLLTRFLRLGTRPEAAFFFLVAGLAAAAFEFYAAGAGLAAAVAVLSLFLAGYGFASLPVNWWAVVLAVLGIGLYNWDFQRHELGIRSIVGTMLLLWGGLAFVGGTPQLATKWWAVVMVVAGIILFYLFAMTTIVRSRFGTPTIGREHLIGATGTAETALHPDGVVLIDGARWRARAHRAAVVEPGAPIEVLAVEGVTLQVAPPAAAD